MTTTLEFVGTLRITSCWCGIHLAIPSDLWDAAQADPKHAIYCPLGHTFVYSKNALTRERDRSAALERQLNMSRDATRWERDQRQAAERSNAAYRGWITRLRNRIANGVCPVKGCHRHFDNVQNHIQTQHPDWAIAHPEALS